MFADDFELGAVASNQQAVLQQLDDENEFAPIINYRGERFSIQYGTLIYTLYQSDHTLIQLIGEARSLGYEASDSAALAGMNERKNAFEAGLQLATGGDWGVLQMHLLQDISDTHQGFEASLAYLHPLEQGRWMFEPAIGVKAQSKELVDYYYGVKTREATGQRQAFLGKATLNPYAEFALAYKIDRKWTMIGGMEYTQLGKEISASPLVDKDHLLITFSALVYTF